MRRVITAFLLVFSAILLAACASWFMHGEPPEVIVTNIIPLETSAFEQRMKVDLRINNPNDYDLHVTGMDFKLDVNGKRLARGLSNKDLIVPRLAMAVTSVETSTSTLDLIRQAFGMSQKQELAYTITGVLHLSDGRLPFEHAGTVLENGRLSGSPPPAPASP
jgi:LEA14-like dessication related protein